MVSLDIHHTSLSMNGMFSIISNLFPFNLSSSKDSERVFHQPVGGVKLMELCFYTGKGCRKSSADLSTAAEL